MNTLNATQIKHLQAFGPDAWKSFSNITKAVYGNAKSIGRTRKIITDLTALDFLEWRNGHGDTMEFCRTPKGTAALEQIGGVQNQ